MDVNNALRTGVEVCYPRLPCILFVNKQAEMLDSKVDTDCHAQQTRKRTSSLFVPESPWNFDVGLKARLHDTTGCQFGSTTGCIM